MLRALEEDAAPVIGLGLDDSSLDASIPLPLVAERLLATLANLTAVSGTNERAGPLALDAGRRLAVSDGREVALTRTEFRLLQVLLDHQPREVPLLELLQAVWGFTEGRGTSELVRAHVRNLRVKLGQLGLPDAVRSRRGQGYALVV
jgi:DNA-binding response OmpR family regulator